MWQAPNQKVGALQSAKKRKEERLKRPLHIRRVEAEIRLVPTNETHVQATTENDCPNFDARVLLNDLSAHGMGLYVPVRMVPGTRITITLEDPSKIVLNCVVMWAQDKQDVGPVISTLPPAYRIGVRFVFGSAEEEKAFLAYFEQVQQQHLYQKPE